MTAARDMRLGAITFLSNDREMSNLGGAAAQHCDGAPQLLMLRSCPRGLGRHERASSANRVVAGDLASTVLACDGRSGQRAGKLLLKVTADPLVFITVASRPDRPDRPLDPRAWALTVT